MPEYLCLSLYNDERRGGSKTDTDCIKLYWIGGVNLTTEIRHKYRKSEDQKAKLGFQHDPLSLILGSNFKKSSDVHTTQTQVENVPSS